MKTNIKNPMVFFYVFVWRRVLTFIGFGYTVNGVKLPNVQKPTGLHKWYLKNGFSYQEDEIDGIKHWSLFLTDKGGDCDDYVEFAFRVLVKRDYKCKRLYLMGKKVESHVVLVAEKYNEFHIMDTIAHHKFDSFESILSFYEEDGYTKYLLI